MDVEPTNDARIFTSTHVPCGVLTVHHVATRKHPPHRLSRQRVINFFIHFNSKKFKKNPEKSLKLENS